MLAISAIKPNQVDVTTIPTPEPGSARINFISGPLAASSLQPKLRWSNG